MKREKRQDKQKERRFPNLTLRREEFEKFMFFLQGLHISMPFNQDKPMRVVMIYDPQKPSVHFYSLTDEEKLKDVPEY